MSTTITRRPRLQGFWAQWGSLGVYSKLTAVSDNVDTTGIGVVGAVTDKDTWFMDPLLIDLLSVISSVTIVSHEQGAASNDSSNLLVRFAATDILSQTYTYTGTFPTLQTNRFKAPRPTGGNWSPADVDNGEFGFGGHNFSAHATPGGMYLAIEVVYDVAGVLIEQIRNVMALLVARYGVLPDKLSLPIAAGLLGLRPSDIVSVAHRMLPTGEGTGRGSEQWERLIGRIYEKEVDLDNLAAGPVIRFEDLRDVLKRYWDGGISPLEPGGRKDGVLILSPGGARTYDGPPLVVDSPVSGQQVQVVEDVEAVGAHGRLHVSLSQNTVLNSAFILGETSWATVASDPAVFGFAPEWWDPTISTQHLVLLDSLGVESCEQSGIVAASGRNTISIAHREILNVGHNLVLRVQRASDSFFLRQDGTWQSGAISITVPNAPAWQRFILGIDQSAGATSYTVRLSSSGAGHRTEVAHVQLNPGAWAAAPIVTTAAAVTRASNSLLEDNAAANRKLRVDRGCWRGLVELLWNSQDVVAGSDFYVWRAAYDASNEMSLRYDVSSSAWVFQREAAGVVSEVSIPAAVVRGEVYALTVTWQSLGGENDEGAFTISITLGTQLRATGSSGAMAERPTSDWWLGSFDATSGQLNGFLWDSQVLDYVPKPSENRRYARS